MQVHLQLDIHTLNIVNKSFNLIMEFHQMNTLNSNAKYSAKLQKQIPNLISIHLDSIHLRMHP